MKEIGVMAEAPTAGGGIVEGVQGHKGVVPTPPCGGKNWKMVQVDNQSRENVETLSRWKKHVQQREDGNPWWRVMGSKASQVMGVRK